MSHQSSRSHKKPTVRAIWGAGSITIYGDVTDFNYSYTLFNNLGLPLRAEVSMTIKEEPSSLSRLFQSPDISRSPQVKAGDSIVNFCEEYYEDKNYYLKIAEYNNLSSFRKIKRRHRFTIPTNNHLNMFDLLPKPSKTINQLVSYKLKFNGNTLDDEIKVYGIEVEKKINKISRAKISIFGGDVNLKTFDISEKSFLKPGSSVEIQFGYDNLTTKVFEGIINKQKVSLLNGYRSNRSKSLLVLDCVDKAIKLTNSYTNDIYENKSDSEIISSVISKSGISKSVEMTTLKHPFFPKHNSNDWEFILERSKLNGLVIINSDNKIEIKDPYSSFAIPELLIEHGDATINFDAQVDSSYQYGSLEYSSWDPYNEKSLKSISQEPSLNTPGNIKHSSIKNITSPSKTSVTFSQPLSSGELKELAKSKFLQSRLSSHCGSITVKGVNSIKLSSLIRLKGFGKTFDGSVYVSSVHQKLIEGIYTTVIGFGIKGIF